MKALPIASIFLVSKVRIKSSVQSKENRRVIEVLRREMMEGNSHLGM